MNLSEYCFPGLENWNFLAQSVQGRITGSHQKCQAAWDLAEVLALVGWVILGHL